MKKKVINEINEIKYLFEYKPGKIISEQESFYLNENELPQSDVEKTLAGVITKLGYSLKKPNDPILSNKPIKISKLKSIKPEEFLFLDGEEDSIDLEKEIYPTSLENEVETKIASIEKKAEDTVASKAQEVGIPQKLDALNKEITNMSESDLTRIVKRIIG